MKLRNQDKIVVNNEQENDDDETTTNGDNSSTAHMHLKDEDKEKGNFKHFNISKKTIKKLKGNFENIPNTK